MWRKLVMGTLCTLCTVLASDCEESGFIQQARRLFSPDVSPPASTKFSTQHLEQAANMSKMVKNLPKKPLPSCKVDLRPSLPACQQYAAEWCWATGPAQIAGYFDPTHTPESQDVEELGTGGLQKDVQRAESCLGMECRIVGNRLHPTVMDACCTEDVSPKRSECDAVGYPENIIQGITWSSGQDYVGIPGHLPEEYLILALSKGHPMLFSVQWEGGGGHTMLLGGCGDGKYYVHDSLTNLTLSPPWQELTYEEILLYIPWAQVGIEARSSKESGRWIPGPEFEKLMREHQLGGHWSYTYMLRKDVCDLLPPQYYKVYCESSGSIWNLP